MILILIALIVLSAASITLIRASENNGSFFAFLLGLISSACAAFGLASYAFSVWSYMAAEYKAEVINREYGTNYTQEEVYWASDVIDTVRDLDRNRIEINGNLFGGEQ